MDHKNSMLRERRRPPRATTGFYHMTFQKRPNYRDKSEEWLLGLGLGRELALRLLKGNFWCDGNSLYIECCDA